MTYIVWLLKFSAYFVMWSLLLLALFFAINYAFGRGWISQKYNPDLLWGPIFSEYEIAEREK
jgi:hypothetical protein